MVLTKIYFLRIVLNRAKISLYLKASPIEKCHAHNLQLPFSTDEEAVASKRMVIYAFSAQINLFTSFFVKQPLRNTVFILFPFTRYFPPFPCPLSIARASILSCEYRAWVCAVLPVSRMGVCCPPRIARGCVLSSVYRALVCFLLVARVGVCWPASIVRGFVLSSEYRACVHVHFARSLVFRRN